ncbi:MAG: hypothetical protein ABW321_35250, partial [Polyangiales bacterium]
MDKREYTASIRRALEEFERGHWEEARTFFAAAHARNPSARTLRGLALTAYELRAYVDAIALFEQALTDQRQPLTARMRSECESFAAHARQFVTRAQIALEPAEAQLDVDGKPVTRQPDGTLGLDPGRHEISARAEGYRAATRIVHADGSPLALTLQLEPAHAPELPPPAAATPVATPAPAAPPPAALAGEPSTGSSSPSWPWIVIGGSAAVAAVGGVFIALAAS